MTCSGMGGTPWGRSAGPAFDQGLGWCWESQHGRPSVCAVSGIRGGWFQDTLGHQNLQMLKSLV